MGDNGSTSPYIPRAVTRGYSSILGSVLYSPWIWSTSYALAQDEQTPELMYRDAVVAHAFQHRKLLVTGSNWHLEPASAAPVDKHVAGVVEALLRRVSRFAQARFNLSEGVIRGSSWAGIRGDWTWRAILGDQTRRWWAPTELVDVDTRRFRQRRDGEEARYTWEIDRYFPRRWEAIDLRHYLHHVVDDFEGTAGQGRGLMDLLWPYWRNKAELLKLWLQRLDRWALGNIFAKVSLDEEGRRDPNASTMVASWLATLDKMRAGHVCVYDSQDEVELVETSGDGSEIRAAIDYVDEAMVRLSLGATLPTGGGKGAGSYARADVELDVMHSKAALDRQGLEETITRDLVGLIYEANYATLVASCNGARPSGCPSFLLTADKKSDPLAEVSKLEKLVAMGVPLREDEVYAASGYTPPAPGDRLFKPAQKALEAPRPSLAEMAQAGSLPRWARDPRWEVEPGLVRTARGFEARRPGFSGPEESAAEWLRYAASAVTPPSDPNFSAER